MLVDGLGEDGTLDECGGGFGRGGGDEEDGGGWCVGEDGDGDVVQLSEGVELSEAEVFMKLAEAD